MRAFHSNKVFWFLGLPVVFVWLFLTVVGSRLLINPTKLEVTPCGSVVMSRSYPLVDLLGLDYPMVRYVTTITPLTADTNDGYVCRQDNGEGQRYNHDHGRGFGKWVIRGFASPCLADPEGFTIHTQYTGLLFGILPLRPIDISAVVVTRDHGWGLCPFRNSLPETQGADGVK